MGKAEVLCNGLVEDAKRMWKVYATIRRDVVSCRDPPSCTREVTETIDRNYGRLIKWADVECRGEVREMMFNWMDRRADSFAGERMLKKCRDPRPSTQNPPQSVNQTDVRSFGEKVAYFAHQVGATVLIKRDVVYIRELNACFSQTISDRLRRNSCPILYTTESLLLRGSN